MSPAEATALTDEPDWAKLFKEHGSTEWAFEDLLIQWRRWHWTPVMIDGVERRKPADAPPGIVALALLGVMPPRTLIPKYEGYQYDDHMFLMSQGREWRIVAIEDKMLLLKSEDEVWQIDLSRAKWDKYLEGAVAALEAHR